MDVLIEHENDEYIEEEMWKLLMWRSPLKVLVCYDWAENEKTTCKRIQWLKNKLDELADMARQVNETWNEAEETEYLIVIGTLNSDDNVCWKFKKLTKTIGGSTTLEDRTGVREGGNPIPHPLSSTPINQSPENQAPQRAFHHSQSIPQKPIPALSNP